MSQWSPGLILHPLMPMEWYTVGHSMTPDSTNIDSMWQPVSLIGSSTALIWAPPPTAAEAILEELSISWHKCPTMSHLFICPRLFTHAWQKCLYKLADYIFFLPAGHHPIVWPSLEFEPLVIGVLLPHQTVTPWCLRLLPCYNFTQLSALHVQFKFL